MAAAKRAKASDKQDVCKKLVLFLKKRYKGAVPQQSRSVLEIMLYAICLEEATHEQAVAALERLRAGFNDLNEIRVSSVTELEPVFEGMRHAQWRAYRVRGVLQYVFERQFEFDFQVLLRKTLELATKQLQKIKCLSPFVRAYTLQEALGCHTVPVDEPMLNASIWLGLVEPATSPADAADALKPAVRKADVPLFCHLLRRLTNDPAVAGVFRNEKLRDVEEDYDLDTAVERLAELCDSGEKRLSAPKKAKAKKPAAVSTQKSARKTTASKPKSSTATKQKTSKPKSGGTTKKKPRKAASR